MSKVFTCIDCDRVWEEPRPESCDCGGDFMREEDIDDKSLEDKAHEDAVVREAAYLIRRAEVEEYMGEDSKPWAESDEEPVTMGDFRRFPPGSDERELIICHLLLDIWNELEHLRAHVCPHSDEDIEGMDDDSQGDDLDGDA